MGKAKLKPFEGSENSGLDMDAEYAFERTTMFRGRVLVDLDPGPEMRAGFYSPEEFAATFDVIEE